MLAKTGPNYSPTSRGKHYFPTKAVNMANLPQSLLLSHYSHPFLMRLPDINKSDCVESRTLDWKVLSSTCTKFKEKCA